ncbi:hypothetical protein [Pseudoalteromonas luteoviolacea]|uniref:Uncharacterized protein n=1 Tax=Pseudoalteromonas luteoviolacea S4054 TaxID=1129367 RepID=A0A0F6AGV6_9GAMM|nr:hypothetical protein [Pseudoalteromonas luteoviolacea]AOT07146.1 hypothetical protein S4054249_04400 [Pseudoalteromonas luteoviolacea]AOT12063.1 hypothetical protein S40542_04400 [Pseudoalteromonas luteoviolacea]AOT16976.1 hypothetical protein S4054_04400 [Pseudoalteromonas luteoviolacea]KKE85437.1 hypothetical protein N479_05385 [Pseudoalteromonas luteoviolacea S4054]KZN73785.1 hypothetical protein N481_11795 [Pseudoalteromonas luteoviolacea S4047-1]
MSLREIKKQKTADQLMEAIKRIVDNQPTCKDLKNKIAAGKQLKLNPTNVEKEAGLSYNSTKSHKPVLDEIDRINSLKVNEAGNNARKIANQKIQRAKKSKEINSLKDEIKSKNDEIEMLKRVNLNLHSHCRELTTALYQKIPQEEREALFDKLLGDSNDSNIIPFKD